METNPGHLVIEEKSGASQLLPKEYRVDSVLSEKLEIYSGLQQNLFRLGVDFFCFLVEVQIKLPSAHRLRHIAFAVGESDTELY